MKHPVFECLAEERAPSLEPTPSGKLVDHAYV
jgi:hypothetical protein